MKRPANYNTKQRKVILSYIAAMGGGHVTAARIVKHFENEDISIGRTTIYRHLDKLTENGNVRKYNIDGTTGACYQYVTDRAACLTHLHLKCEGCGRLLHLQYDAMDKIHQEIFDKCAFKVNPMKTILYGKCDNCV